MCSVLFHSPFHSLLHHSSPITLVVRSLTLMWRLASADCEAISKRIGHAGSCVASLKHHPIRKTLQPYTSTTLYLLIFAKAYSQQKCAKQWRWTSSDSPLLCCPGLSNHSQYQVLFTCLTFACTINITPEAIKNSHRQT